MRSRFLSHPLVLIWLCIQQVCSPVEAVDGTPLKLKLRKRTEVAPKTDRWHAVTTSTDWDPQKTAIVICDMWDNHWCSAATSRVVEMAPRMNDVINAARARGVTILHCPSDTMDFYQDFPQRKRAQMAPVVETDRPLNHWCHIDPAKEPPLPIDDTDGGCDCLEPAKSYRAWSRQIETLEIHKDDVITDSDEAFRIMKQSNITNVIVMGVHANMCVLGRPFSIRQLVYQGMNVALMRDLTDSMYNPRMRPFVSHFTGNDLMIEHIEKYWCPTLTSADFLGDKPFRFREDTRSHLVVLVAEDEYKTESTLPAFTAKHLGHDFKTSFVFESPPHEKNQHDMPGIDVIEEADLLLISVRRRVLPTTQIDLVKRYVAAGKPVVGIRTANHPFAFKTPKTRDGFVEWPEFDREVIGGNYQGHTGGVTKAILEPLPGLSHPILSGVSPNGFQSGGTLYLTKPLDPNATELMRGHVAGIDEQHPAAWTFQRRDGGRTFYTSSGHPDDFENTSFTRMLLNSIYWAAGREVPK